MKTEILQLLINNQDNNKIKLRLLKEFIVELTDLNWHSTILLLEKFDFVYVGADGSIVTLLFNRV